MTITIDRIPDESLPEYHLLQRLYKKRFGRDFPLDEPKTFFEKLGWLKIFDRRSLLVTLVDKVQVREYVRDRVGERYLIRCIDVLSSASEIDIPSLPAAGILKATHGWKMNFRWTDKQSVRWSAVMEVADGWLRHQHGLARGEWMYRHIKPRLVVEELLCDDGRPLHDYKFYCFNGVPRFLHIDINLLEESDERIYVDTDWVTMDLVWARLPAPKEKPPKPDNFEEMLIVAAKLARGHCFVRVDLYNVSGRVFFGELTLFPSGGWAHLEPESWDGILGEWLQLPSVMPADD